MDDLTFVVKTFNRPDVLRRCLMSVRQYAPGSPVVVVDDGTTLAAEVFDVESLCSEYHALQGEDIGLSAGRNLGVSRVQTPLTMVLDDDHELVDETRLGVTADVVRRGELDMLSVRQVHPNRDDNWWGVLYVRGTTLYGRKAWYWREDTYARVDVASNSMVASTSVLRDLRWDEDLKLAEHFDFFLRAKRRELRVGVRPGCYVRHNVFTGSRDEVAYSKFRKRAARFKRRAMRKHGLTRLHLFGSKEEL